MRYTPEIIERILPGVWDESILLEERSPYAPAPDMPKMKKDPATSGDILAMICDVQQAYRNSGLDGRQKAVLLLHDGMGYTFAEASSKTGWSADTLSRDRASALAAMTAYLNGEDT